MWILDLFIKDTDSQSYDQLYRIRIIVLALLMMTFVGIAFLLATKLGLYSCPHPELIITTNVFCLLLMRFIGKADVVLFVLLTLGSYVIYSIAMGWGVRLSHSVKWFVVLVSIVAFMKFKWLIPYGITALAIIGLLYYQAISGDIGLQQKQHFIQEFISNSAFFILIFLGNYIFFDYLAKKINHLEEKEVLLTEKTHQLQKSNQELERFAHTVSHDIKSPLKNIITFTHLLEKELHLFLTPKSKEHLQFIKSGGQELNTLVNDVLSYSSFDNKPEKEILIDLNEIVSSIKTLLHESLQERQAAILIKNSLPQIKARRTLMLLLFKNLIENGIKYNDSEFPTIRIRSRVTESDLLIEIEDNGIGIKEKYHDQIFEKFARLHSKSKFEGTGLGLAYCSKIADEYGGTISIDSLPKEGSSFTIKLPKELIVQD